MASRPRANDEWLHDPDFHPTGWFVVYQRRTTYTDWRRLYLPSAESLAWDKPPAETNAALGASREGYVYAVIQPSGRKATQVPGCGGRCAGLKVRLHFINESFDAGFTTGESTEAWLTKAGGFSVPDLDGILTFDYNGAADLLAHVLTGQADIPLVR